MIDAGAVFLAKAEESLSGAEIEFANGWYNNCANRCYYACFQAAIHALVLAGIEPGGTRTQRGHAFVQAEFVGELINRRKAYSPALRDALIRTLELRLVADYRHELVTARQASRSLQRARELVGALMTGRT